MTVRVAVLPGDGIGPEVTAEAARVLRCVGALSHRDFRLTEHPIGGAAIKLTGRALPDSTLEACRAADAVLLGAVGDPEFDAEPPSKRPEAALLALRQALGGFANLRPAKCHDALAACSPFKPDRIQGADMLIVRELLGGLYYGSPRGIDEDGQAAWNTLRYSRAEIARVARVAFEQARLRRRHMTSVDKANVLETSRLWREVVSGIALEYPDVALEHVYVDACALRLAIDPTSFDVIVTENLFGDILSDQAAAVAGSLGMLASASIGGGVGLFEPVHGSAPDLAGRGLANPLGAIASAALLLRHAAGLGAEADDVEHAIGEVLDRGLRTRDIAFAGETWVTTSEMGDAVEHALAEAIDRRHAYHAV